MTEPLVPPPHDHLIETEVDGEICLYDPKREKVTVLNATASDVWRMVDGTLTKGQIIDALAASYGMNPDQISADVDSTITAFQQADLIA